jgi:hypothetical protein
MTNEERSLYKRVFQAPFATNSQSAIDSLGGGSEAIREEHRNIDRRVMSYPLTPCFERLIDILLLL